MSEVEVSMRHKVIAVSTIFIIATTTLIIAVGKSNAKDSTIAQAEAVPLVVMGIIKDDTDFVLDSVEVSGDEVKKEVDDISSVNNVNDMKNTKINDVEVQVSETQDVEVQAIETQNVNVQENAQEMKMSAANNLGSEEVHIECKSSSMSTI